ncbi:MAG: hypothetical protein LAQ69_21820 [Acidobacteriia bacterium]|nr:hypothetical protein [Terriglobia bacterium]
MPVDVNRLRTERVYESRVPMGTLAADLAMIESLAAEWRAARRRLQLAGAGVLIAGLVGLALFVPVGIALLALAIYLFFRVRSYPKAVANHRARCEFVKSLAAMLASDADARAQATMRLAFDPKRELLSESALPHRKNGKQRFYKASWFSIETGLHDGTTFTETIDDLVRQRSFTNPRGKSKTKTRIQSMIAMRFAYPCEVYGDATPLGEKMQKEIQLPPAAAMKGLEVTGRLVELKVLLTGSEDLARASSMLALGVYRMLNLSREIEARKRAQPKKGDAQ